MGLYQAVIYGIINPNWEGKEDDVCLSIVDIEEDHGDGRSYCVQTSYECSKEYIGLLIAIDNDSLSEEACCGNLSKGRPVIPIDNFPGWVRDNFHKEYNKAEKFWEEKVKPLLEKYNINGEPELYLIYDWA